jgi:hypothetical protein
LASKRRGEKGDLGFWIEDGVGSFDLGNRIAIGLESISEDGSFFI